MTDKKLFSERIIETEDKNKELENKMAEGLYKFDFNCGRHGYLSGAFIEEADAIESLVGQEVYFGEVLGKHSEVYGVIEEDDITLVTDDPQVVATLKAAGFHSGHNPFDYLEEE